MFKRACLTMAAVACLGAATANGAVIGTYTFDGTTAGVPADKTVDSQPANATFHDFVVVGVTEITNAKDNGQPIVSNGNRLATGASSSGGSDGWSATDMDWQAGKYVGFTIEADTGFQIDPNSITMTYQKANPDNSPQRGRMIVSSDGFATFLEFELYHNVPDSAADVNIGPFDLSSLDPAQSFEFRMQFSGYSGAGTGNIRLDNVALDATVVPEPMSLGMLSLGGLGLLARRRRA